MLRSPSRDKNKDKTTFESVSVLKFATWHIQQSLWLLVIGILMERNERVLPFGVQETDITTPVTEFVNFRTGNTKEDAI
jgi:hypothetical protein